MTLNRAELIDFATQKYFANVDVKNLDAVLDCFHDTAHFTVQTAFTRHDGIGEIKRMFVDFMGSYDVIRHYNFRTTVDTKEQRICAYFDVQLVAPDGSETALYNTNFWRLRDGRFQEVFVYMSGANPLV